MKTHAFTLVTHCEIGTGEIPNFSDLRITLGMLSSDCRLYALTSDFSDRIFNASTHLERLAELETLACTTDEADELNAHLLILRDEINDIHKAVYIKISSMSAMNYRKLMSGLQRLKDHYTAKKQSTEALEKALVEGLASSERFSKELTQHHPGDVYTTELCAARQAEKEAFEKIVSAMKHRNSVDFR